jgi:hypothetical protein
MSEPCGPEGFRALTHDGLEGMVLGDSEDKGSKDGKTVNRENSLR